MTADQPHLYQLTHRFREQARSYRRTVAAPILTPYPKTNVRASLLAKAAFLPPLYQLTHRFRKHARSHKKLPDSVGMLLFCG